MARPDHLIYAVHVTDRVHQAGEVQRLLTEYGSQIKTRLGLHEAGEQVSAPNGLLLLEMVGGPARCQPLLDKLNALAGIEAKAIAFSHS